MDRLIQKNNERERHDVYAQAKKAEIKRNWTNLAILILTWIIPLIICTRVIVSNQKQVITKLDTLIVARTGDTTWKMNVDTLYMAKKLDTVRLHVVYTKVKDLTIKDTLK